MIEKIIFKNLYSFKDQQIVNFDGKIPVYAIYGKNSAGKTNFLKVLALLQATLTDEFTVEEVKHIKNKFTKDPIVEIAVQFIVDKIQYFYKVEIDVDDNEIKEQHLIDIKTNESLFIYKNGNLESESLSEDEVNILKNYNISKNGIFRYIDELKNSESNDKIKNIKKYFNISRSRNKLLKILVSNKEMQQEIVKELNAIDISITNMNLVSNKEMKDSILENDKISKEDKNEFLNMIPDYKVITVHGDVEMDLALESKGTNKYFDLLLKYLVYSKVSNDNYIFLEDELETSLHDEVFAKFLKLYSLNVKSQLIFTTHNQKILDDKLLPKDNIIFVDRKENDSEIYMLSDYPDLRNDNRHNWKKMYNKNMFGAKPNVD